jgi:hypothetical protein
MLTIDLSDQRRSATDARVVATAHRFASPVTDRRAFVRRVRKRISVLMRPL